MASISKIGHSWRALVRRKGFKPLCKTFRTKSAALEWSRRVEADIDAGVHSQHGPAEAVEDAILHYRTPREHARSALPDASTDCAADFSAWRRLRREGNADFDPESWRILGITPCEYPDLGLARAFRAQATAVAVDLGRDSSKWPGVVSGISEMGSDGCGVRIPDHVAIGPDDIPGNAAFVILDAGHAIKNWRDRFLVLVQVTSVAEAESALAAGAAGLISKGQESGGRVGEESSFILLQRILDLTAEKRIPVWCQGGIGLHAAAGAVAAGAFGVVLDAQLALLRECGLPENIKTDIRGMDGSEMRLLGGYSVYSRPGPAPVGEAEPSPADVRVLLTDASLLPLGQDAALAKLLAARCADAGSLLHALRMGMAGHLRQAVALKSLDENSPLARAHGTRYPIAQGPMTRVSDTAEFACAVAREGALPFLALSLMDEAQSRRLLEATRDAIGTHSWGVGVLGFAAPEILEPQLALIREFRPSAVLLAGGRPAQARALVAEGIPAYLHVPSPGLLGMFLKDGARHFIFEGRECGGHVGPRYSFVLWEQQIALLLEFEHPEELHLLFAGGIHDERSAATVAAIAAPLAARGAKIGVLMGTAYITTHEAVACGAVNENFRRKVIAGDTTVLLETAPGHATRCLPTNFVERFNAEKIRLQAIEADPKKIWKALEDFNIGRLRIATKGVQRDGGNLVKVGVRGQQAEGLYMIGQLAALRHSVNSIAELHRAVSRGATAQLEACAVPAPKRAANAEPVAIVGMACIYPGSPDIESFWANIVEGRNLITEVSAMRWNADVYYREGATERGKTPSKWGGFIDEVAFDPLRYGIPPQSLAAIEPIQLLSLEVARRALADAGYDERFFDRDRTSVIFGAEAGMDLSNAYVFRNNYAHYLGAMPEELDAALPDLTEDSFPGVLANVISGRIANRLGFGGVNYSVDSACASSLTALELSVKELRSGGSDLVLAGGADFHNSIHDFLMFASVKALSPTGACRSFDDAADGICLGEGVGVMVLKRLADAERDGDRIYAVIDGIAGSSDGKGLGLTAPRREGQMRALERAYGQAGIMPGDIGLVEAHGTGTVVGDRTELQTLTDIYNAGGALPLRTALGSVKSQIGHTKCAAGMAGLIKVSKALYHKVLPPTLNIDKPNAGYDAHHSPFMLNGFSMPWLFGKEGHAAVSAFGFGGANFHAILSAHPASGAQVDSGVKKWPVELFFFRGETFSDAAGLIRKLGRFLRESDAPLQLRDLAYTVCNLGSGPVQCAFVAGSDDLADRLECALDRGRHADICYREEASQGQGRLAFVFPGQGSQSPGMLRDLFVAFPALHAILDAGAAWRDRMLPPAAYSREQQRRQSQELTDTRVAQPALGMADYAMATLLRAINIAPDMLAGHSYGELVALAVAGCFDLRDLLRLSEQRGVSILEAAGEDAGCMAAVSAGTEELARIFGADSGVVLANQNSPAQSILSGSTAAIGRALDTLKAKGIAARTIEVACAFHSPLIAGAEKTFGAALDGQPVRRQELPVYGNSTAQTYPENPADIKRQMAAQIVKPVRFVEQIERMHADGARIFVEVGPGSVLTGLIGKILAGKPHLAVATDRKGQPGIPNLLRAVAQIAVIRDGIDPAMLWRGRSPARLDFDHPCKLPPSCWMVDGARARPLHGALPRHAGRVVTKPLQAVALRGELSGAGAAQLSSSDRTVLQYLNNMHDLVQAQRDIMLSMLGQPPAEGTARTSAQSAAAAAGHRISVSIPAPDVMPNINATPNFAHAPVAAAGDVRASLLAIVSERTGYPAEMLDAGLDLEADLSIDSIKRLEIVGELAERHGLRLRLGAEADALLERLAAQKTLEAIVACLQEALPAVAGAPAAPLALSVSATSPASSSFVSADSAQQTLQAIVSGRTGYPEDALDLDLDLEADLSIDSIKRLEIVGELAERLGLERLLADKDSALESLAALKTLRAIVDWLKAHAGIDAAVSAATASASQSGAGAPEDDQIALSRYVLRSADAPGVISGHNQLAGKNFLVTDDGLGIAARFAARLESYGARVRVIDFSENVPLPDDLAQVDGLVHLFGLNPLSRVRDAKRFFDLLRETLPHKTVSLLVASGLGGGFGHFRVNGQKVSGDFGHGAGLSGMLKTVAKEWPEVRVHCVDLDTSESADDLASYLEIELLADNPLAEVGYRAGSRQVIQILESPLRRDDAIDNLALDRNSVLLLTGGARGITAQIALAFARRYGCRLELVGRSPLPTEADTEPGIAARDQKGLRQALIAAHPELKPADIEKRCAQIMAAREVRQSLADIEAAGGKVGYTALDVRDIAAFAALIHELYRRHGRIDGVIHGAGVVDDKLLRHKSAESFARVFDTKVRGALMLYNQIHDNVGFVVFFSSVAGAFGNKGQIDYAAANDVLDKIAHAMQARVKGRVLSINWGPWAGKGMVSAELKREFSRKGIGLIPLQAGADALLDELCFGTKDDTQIVLMCAEPESFGVRGELSRLL